jgi:hypothetical protein
LCNQLVDLLVNLLYLPQFPVCLDLQVFSPKLSYLTLLVLALHCKHRQIQVKAVDLIRQPLHELLIVLLFVLLKLIHEELGFLILGLKVGFQCLVLSK